MSAIAMPRVLVQLNSLGLGGTQLNALDLAVEVKRWGYESVLVGPAETIPRGPSLLDVAAEKGVNISLFHRPRTTLSGALTMRNLANKHNADILHVYGSGEYRSAWWGACGLARRPLVLTVYEMSVEELTHQRIPLIVGTRYLEEDLAARAGGVHLISPPVDIARDDTAVVSADAFIKTHELNPENLRVVMVTRLDEEMKAASVEAAVEAIGLLNRPDVDLLVIGTGSAEQRLRQAGAAVNHRLGRNAVIFTGPMADPRPAYAAADVMIGMGGSAARTLSFAKPLIVAGDAGWFQLFTPTSAEELFRSSFWNPAMVTNSAQLLVSILNPLLADNPQRESLGVFGRTFAQTHFGLPAMAAKLAKVYEAASRTASPRMWAQDLSMEAEHLRRRLAAGTQRKRSHQ